MTKDHMVAMLDDTIEKPMTNVNFNQHGGHDRATRISGLRVEVE